jgi:MFS superfamily sulfate permease-like transporter
MQPGAILRSASRNLPAGLALAGLMLPEAVAYAGIAGLAPGRALVAAIAGGLVYALLGGSRFAAISPTSSSAAILAAALAGLGLSGTLPASAPSAEPARAMIAAALTLLVALIFLVMRLFRLGALTQFVPRPVLRGFAFGLALTIIVKQLPRLFGVPVTPGPVWHVLGALGASARAWNPVAMALGALAFAAILLARRWPRWPGALGVIVAGVAVGVFGRPEAWHLALAGPVVLVLPGFDAQRSVPWLQLLPLAAPIALILLAESWGTMRALALKHGDPLDADRELGAIGAANLGAALLGGMPVGAGFSAGNANESAGATSRWAGAVASGALLALALLAGPWIARIPECVLAAVVIAALTHALNPAPLLRLVQLRRDASIALAAAVGVLALGVLDGMLAACALSVVHLLYTLSHPQISELGRVGDSHDYVDLARHGDAARVVGIAIFRPNAPLFFANAETVLRAIGTKVRASPARELVLSLEESNDLDSTSLEALLEFTGAMATLGRRVVLARTHDAVRDLLVAAGHAALARNATFSVAGAVAELAAKRGAAWQDPVA